MKASYTTVSCTSSTNTTGSAHQYHQHYSVLPGDSTLRSYNDILIRCRYRSEFIMEHLELSTEMAGTGGKILVYKFTTLLEGQSFAFSRCRSSSNLRESTHRKRKSDGWVVGLSTKKIFARNTLAEDEYYINPPYSFAFDRDYKHIFFYFKERSSSIQWRVAACTKLALSA
ncbi:hypothetical protein JTE90_027465 [Oedothorax gibbosus]|uniref:Uncharacterized protein n=1 Tax=Oedothorax gibbosus TaxID=931172 RepID=A0AAV6TQC6_9ARAC|nr:hypothetical protein JTE90_027465 [Oedothorax gibbosus]